MNLSPHQEKALNEIDALILQETDASTRHALEEGRAAFLDYAKEHVVFTREEAI